MAHNEAPIGKLNIDLIELKEHGGVTSPGMSGSLFLSGGALTWHSSSGTVVIVGGA